MSDPIETVDVHQRPHDVIKVRTQSNEYLKVSNCMLGRVETDEIKEGCVPDDIPEYGDVPKGELKCHADWRGGCPDA